ncbi:hypothetical protein NQ315_007004 [Exocentrus adspersus]|uniref:N-acetyltransferase domain-containing protein n=1 Tax=Exocentrus adspersus TaxID=1586481 RepID=A0AAV8WD29_9CUCU|nr:hypothetical protein NQ315_007004 [Exocentrus adspersus]
MLYYIHDKLYTPVRNAIKELGKTFISETPCQMFGISSQEALKFQIQCPDDVYIKKLDTADAKLVDSEWPRRYENSEKFVKLLIEMNGAYGIYLKSNNKLASWILLSMMGQLALLQTLEAHKRKGYASVLVKYASKELAKKGYSPYGTVMADNLASKAIFERAGFKYLDKMTELDQDILVDIPDEDLPKLAEMYKKHQDWAPHVYTTIMTGIEWRKKKKEKYLIFMSPYGCWEEDGTFFVLLAYNTFDIFFFSLGDGANIGEAFRTSRRLHPGNYTSRKPLLFSVHQRLYTPVKKLLQETGKSFIEEIQCYMFSIPSDEALAFEILCPEEVYIKKLDTTHADLVNSLWPHRYENSEKLISLLIEMNGGYGLFSKSSDELVCWVILSMMGQLTMLQTLEAFKRKGYASVILKYASKELAKKGYSATGTVLVDNAASRGMFEKNRIQKFGQSGVFIVQMNNFLWK